MPIMLGAAAVTAAVVPGTAHTQLQDTVQN